MSLPEIKALPVASIAEDDSVLLMWAIDPMLPQALEVIESWGFVYKTVGFYWVKTNIVSNGYFTGLGYYTRANAEQCLLATRGKGLKRISKSVRRLVVAPRRRHSEKPEIVRERIESLFGKIPRVELFARLRAPGWDVFGDEAPGSIDLGVPRL